MEKIRLRKNTTDSSSKAFSQFLAEEHIFIETNMDIKHVQYPEETAGLGMKIGSVSPRHREAFHLGIMKHKLVLLL